MARSTQLAHRRSLPSTTALPREFLLFRPGVNDSVHGPALFDAEAARSVLEHFATHAVDGMVDLEHLSLDPAAESYDPDARGWFGLELRTDGSLWAVNVKWTADGARRLAERTQRYTSPAFHVDKKTGRVLRLVNVAITALPATYETPHLVAASTAAQPPKASAAPPPPTPESLRAYRLSPLWLKRKEDVHEAMRRSQRDPTSETLKRALHRAMVLFTENRDPDPVAARREREAREWAARVRREAAAKKAEAERRAQATVEVATRRAEAAEAERLRQVDAHFVRLEAEERATRAREARAEAARLAETAREEELRKQPYDNDTGCQRRRIFTRHS